MNPPTSIILLGLIGLAAFEIYFTTVFISLFRGDKQDDYKNGDRFMFERRSSFFTKLFAGITKSRMRNNCLSKCPTTNL